MKNQQQAVYDAEEATHFSCGFDDFNELRNWLLDLRETDWWRDCIGEALLFVDVRPVKGKWSSAHTDTVECRCDIALSPFGHNTLTVLHELSHGIARVLHYSESHDPWWARTYLEVVSLVLGPDAYVQLSEAFSARGVEVAEEGLVFRRKDVIAL
jgi:hypothetical protein